MADELDVFHSYVGEFLVRKFSFSHCVIVWCRLLLDRLILKEYENIQFCLPFSTFRLHCKVQPVNVYCENITNAQQIQCGQNAEIFNVKTFIQFSPVQFIYLVVSLPCV